MAVLDAAVIEALVLLAGLNDGQGDRGVVPGAVTRDIDVSWLRSCILQSRFRKKKQMPCPQEFSHPAGPR